MTDPYSRVYWRLVDDDKFADVYMDDAAFALWVRLLMAADMAWPASASLPLSTRKVALDKLASVRLVDLLPANRYRIHGLDKERLERQQQASRAAASRWGVREQSGSNAPAMRPHSGSNADPMPSQAKPSRDEKSQAEPDALALWYDLKGGQVSEKALAFVRDLQGQFGDSRLCAAMTAEYAASGNTVDREFLSRVKGRILVESERRAQASEKRRRDDELAYQRSIQRAIEDATPEEQARIAERKAGIEAFLKGAA